MTNQDSNQTNNAGNEPNSASGNKPDWVIKTPVVRGQNSRLEQTGVAWNREDGGITIRCNGKPDVYLYPNSSNAS